MGNTLEKFFRFFGNDAKAGLTPATIVPVGVACAKGIFRPMFTMMDKKQDPDSKKYAALREGLTEVIAIGVYAGSGRVANFLAKSLTRIQENLPKKDFPKDVFKNIISETNLPKGIDKDRAHAISKTFAKQNSVLSMFGVFLSALVVIPAVCSVVIKPIMKITNKNKTTNVAENNTAKLYNPNFTKNDNYKHLSSFATMYQARPQTGMKVGGV